MINHSLRDFLHKSGDNHFDVIAVKRFLNSHFVVKASNISDNYNFCQKTEAALKQFQSYKNLAQTGRMDIETWRAIGDEIKPSRFEELFGNSPNVKMLRYAMFSYKLRRMFPTETHKELIKYAFQEGGGQYGNGQGGLSALETDAIDYGSKLTDTYFGTGGLVDIPITLFISEAPKHAMTPEGMTVEEAIDAAHEWIQKNSNNARKIQREADERLEETRQELAVRQQQSNGKPVPSSAPNPYLDSGKMISEALTDFGRACHTVYGFGFAGASRLAGIQNADGNGQND